MKPSQVLESILRTLKKKRNTLIVGQPGIGKTTIAKLAAQQTQRDLFISTPALLDPTDQKGLGFVSKDGTHAEFLPIGDMHRLITASKPTLWFIDDIGQGTPAVQASFMPWLLERRSGAHGLPDCVDIISATNERGQKAGVSGLLEPVKSRFHKIITMEADYQEWRNNYAIPNNVPSDIIALLDFYGVKGDNKMFNNFVPSNDMVNSNIPRTWANAADLINDYFEDLEERETFFFSEYDQTDSILFYDVAGAVGLNAASTLWKFRKMKKDLQHSSDFILENPYEAFIPQTLEAQFAVINALSSRANESNFGSILIYGERLFNSKVPREIAVTLMNDSVLRNPELKKTSSFVKMVSTSVFAEAFAGT